MKSTRIVLAATTLVVLSGVAARAEDAKIGFQLTLTSPKGDMGDQLDNKIGYGLGVHGLFDLGSGNAIVPRLDYVTYKRSGTSGGALTWDVKDTILSIGADYNYFVGGKTNQGFYLAGGLGLASGKFETTVSMLGASSTVSVTKGSLYLQAGVGYQFTPNMGAELRYQSLKFSDVEANVDGLGTAGSADISAPSIQASFTVRF